MPGTCELKLPKWPFFLGDAILLGSAYFIYAESVRPMGIWAMVLAIFCLAGAAACGIAPFILEYRAALKLVEVGSLTSVVSQIQHLDQVAAQIAAATGQWETVQQGADKTAAVSQEIAQRMSNEARAFQEFLQRANDNERATLRLEVEKLRRAESEWLQVLVRLLDHVYALHQGALRSGQSNVIEQVGHFQNACRDVARRVGLAPFTANHAEPFDHQRHQLLGDSKPPNGALVGETLAAGYTFQGRLIRPALVRLREPDSSLVQEQTGPSDGVEPETHADIPERNQSPS